MIGIIGAMSEEITHLKDKMDIDLIKSIGRYTFMKGYLYGKEVVLVECGIGKVNAGICATLLINQFNVNKVLFTGVAGGINPDINIGDIVIGEEMIEHDFDATHFGYEYGIIPRMENSFFKSDKKLVEIAKESAIKIFGEEKVWSGRILSGDQFVASGEKIEWLRDTFNGQCVEMEGAAVAHVCETLNKPFVIIRSISDKANSEASMVYEEFVKIAAENSKLIIEGMLEKI